MYISLVMPCVLVTVLLGVAWIVATLFLCFCRKDSRAWTTWIILTMVAVFTAALWIVVNLLADSLQAAGASNNP